VLVIMVGYSYLRNCTKIVKLLQDSFENNFCDFSKEKDSIFAFISSFLVSNQKIMKMPNNIQMELIDMKTKSILKTTFDELSPIPGASGVINFWRPFPAKLSVTKKVRSELYSSSSFDPVVLTTAWPHYSRGQKFKTKVDFCVRSYLFRSIASEIFRNCISLSGERECDARDCFKS